MRRKHLFRIGLLVAFGAVSGEAAADAGRGRQLAERWCTGCHMIGVGGPGSDAAPAFPQVAQNPDRSSDWLRAWLSDPHPPMPNFNLTREEIQDVIDYLATLSP